MRMDKNEFLPCWPEDWFEDFLQRLKPEHISIHPETGNLYDKLESVLGFPKQNIVVTAGSDAAIKSVYEVFVEPGDEVIIPSPTFAMYYIYAQIYRARLIEIDYAQKNISLDLNNFLNAITTRTKLIAIANPNSPTGTIIEKESLIKIIEKASECGAAVLIDEAYYPFYEGSMINMINNFDNLIVTRTFSKAAGMAGMRTGFLLSSEETAQMIFAVKPMYEITTISALLAEYVLDNYDRVFEYSTKVMEGKKYLADYFIKKGFDVYTGYANFLHVDFGRKKKDIVMYLKDNNVLFKDYFDHPSLSRYSRFTVGPKEYLENFIRLFDGFR
jgi:histidinol-phosphate aminotransferase